MIKTAHSNEGSTVRRNNSVPHAAILSGMHYDVYKVSNQWEYEKHVLYQTEGSLHYELSHEAAGDVVENIVYSRLYNNIVVLTN